MNAPEKDGEAFSVAAFAGGSLKEQAGEQLPQDVAGLKKRLAELDLEQQDWMRRIRELSAAENPRKGIHYAAELHEARQFKMMLEFKREYCRVRLNQLKLTDL